MKLSKAQLSQIGIISALLIVAALWRLMPYWIPSLQNTLWNVAPVAAIGIFAAAYIKPRWLAFVLPITVLFGSDVLIAQYSGYPLFHGAFAWVYGSFALIVLLAYLLRGRVNLLNTTLALIGGSVLFFLITNFGAWLMDDGTMYPDTFSGLLLSYELGLPFYRGTLFGDLLFGGVLFGGYALLKSQLPVLRRAEA